MQSISFDSTLPVNQKSDDIRAAMDGHPVVIVCGETRSGKTAQIPKVLLVPGWKQAEYG